MVFRRRRGTTPGHVWYLRAELEQAGLFIDTSIATVRFAIVGAGRLGASLGLALRAHRAPLVGFTAGSPEGRARAEAWLAARSTPDLGELVALRPDAYLITVPDQDLPAVALDLGRRLAAAPPEAAESVVAHTSGATSVSVLDPCREVGAATLVFHPLQTFSDPPSAWRRLAGAAIAITPSPRARDERAQRFGLHLATLLGARPFLLADDKRALYHAAATVACNYLVTLEHAAQRLFVQAGLPEADALALFLPLVRATLDNIGSQGTVEALTGPLSRGDTRTVAGHLHALAADAPDLLPLYRVLGSATLELVRARSEVSPETLAKLSGLLRTLDILDIPEPPLT